jgi:predicted XRE-type DNA-binding protein
MLERPEHIEHLRKIKRELRTEVLAAFGSRTTREIVTATGLHQGDISELRTDSKLNRFSVDRLLLILLMLGCAPAFEVTVPKQKAAV